MIILGPLIQGPTVLWFTDCRCGKVGDVELLDNANKTNT